ncbi:uncharacterized [Tachysurus ichikawai]
MKEDNLIVVRPMAWPTSAGPCGQLFSRGVALMTPSISGTVQRAFAAIITTSEETVEEEEKEKKVEMKPILSVTEVGHTAGAEPSRSVMSLQGLHGLLESSCISF